MRIALGIEYDGTNYHGWQRQDDAVSVQERLEEALSIVAVKTIKVICAGRTDAGVHASGQVVHFDTKASRPDRGWILGANTNLPDDIRVLWARHVPPDFHARYDATLRHYRYVIYINPISSALLRHRAMWSYQQLDEDLMYEAAQHLVGEHDFTSFRGSGCQAKSPVRTIELLEVKRNGAMINIDVKANAFLLHMVRNIVGSLVMVGIKEKPPEWIKEVLEARDRKEASIAAPAQGLYLVKVEYNE